MKSLLISILALSVATLPCIAERPPDELVKKLTSVIREYCPDATTEVTDQAFIAKYGTMLFTVHDEQMDGNILPKPRQVEGPNYKGFLLDIRMQKGPYDGQLGVPQVLHKPYWSTFFDGPSSEDGKNCSWINFSYGSQLDPKLKQAIMDALPKKRFPPPVPSPGCNFPNSIDPKLPELHLGTKDNSPAL